MEILGYIMIIVALLLGSTTVSSFSWGKYRQSSPALIKKWYWKILVFILAIVIGVIGVKLID